MTTQDMRTIAAQTEMHHPARAALLEAAEQIDELTKINNSLCAYCGRKNEEGDRG